MRNIDQRRTYHDGEDTLLHLASILRSEDNHLHALEVDLDGRSRRHSLGETIRRELSCVVDNEIRLAEIEELLLRRPNEHVVLLWSEPEPCTGSETLGAYHE